MAVYFFFGQEEYLIEKEINKLRNELIDTSFASMAYKVFDNPAFSALADCLQSAPLMFGNTLSVIYIDKYLIGKKISLDDKQIEAVDFALNNISNNVNIIFVCKIPRDENKKPDSRLKFYKIISKYSQVKEFAQFPIYKKELNTQIAKMAKEKGMDIYDDNIEIIKEQIGTNLTLIDSELEKLKIAIYPKKKIEASDIKKYCTSSDDIFILADLVIQGNKNEILKQYNLLTEKRHPLEVFSILQNSFQRFIFIKTYEKQMNAKDIALKLRLHEFIIRKTQEKLRKISLKRLTEIRKNLINAEYKLKAGQALIGDTVLELALLS